MKWPHIGAKHYLEIAFFGNLRVPNEAPSQIWDIFIYYSTLQKNSKSQRGCATRTDEAERVSKVPTNQEPSDEQVNSSQTLDTSKGPTNPVSGNDTQTLIYAVILLP